MITLNQEQRLGKKAFLLIISKKTFFAYVFLVIGLVLLVLRSFILSGIVSVMKTFGTVTASSSASAATIATSVILLFFLVAILIFIIGFVVAWLEYKNYTFSIGEFDLVMRKGILSRSEISIPYHQIDSVNIERNLAHQMLGLSRLIMITAAHEESKEHEMAEIVLEPIEKGFAEEIRELLQRKVGVQIVKDEAVADKEVADNTFLK